MSSTQTAGPSPAAPVVPAGFITGAGAAGRPSFDPWRDRAEAVERLLDAREEGATLRQAAAAARVHVATVCRWALRSSKLARALAFTECLVRAQGQVPARAR